MKKRQNQDSSKAFSQLLAFLQQLTEANIYFTLHYIRPETVMVALSVPGQRWEVEFFSDGGIEIERFLSQDGIESPEATQSLLEQLFEEFSD